MPFEAKWKEAILRLDKLRVCNNLALLNRLAPACHAIYNT
jgi:hypothetical protein